MFNSMYHSLVEIDHVSPNNLLENIITPLLSYDVSPKTTQFDEDVSLRISLEVVDDVHK